MRRFKPKRMRRGFKKKRFKKSFRRGSAGRRSTRGVPIGYRW